MSALSLLYCCQFKDRKGTSRHIGRLENTIINDDDDDDSICLFIYSLSRSLTLKHFISCHGRAVHFMHIKYADSYDSITHNGMGELRLTRPRCGMRHRLYYLIDLIFAFCIGNHSSYRVSDKWFGYKTRESYRHRESNWFCLSAASVDIEYCIYIGSHSPLCFDIDNNRWWCVCVVVMFC